MTPLPTMVFCRARADVVHPQLSKYPALNNLEKQTSVPKVYAFLGLVGVYFFLIFFNIAGEFLVNFAGFIIPGYYSLDALFSSSKVDDTQVSLHICYKSGTWHFSIISNLLTWQQWLTVSLNFRDTLDL